MRDDVSGKPLIVLIEDNPSDVYLMSLALEESGVVFEMTSFQSGPRLCRFSASARARRIVLASPTLSCWT